MTKEKEVTVEIRQADSVDAALVVDFLNQVGKESDYMTLDEAGIGMSPADMEQFLMVQEANPVFRHLLHHQKLLHVCWRHANPSFI